MRSDQPQTFFMTGATGFLGQYILRDLLMGGQRVVAMLRGDVTVSGQRLCKQMRDMGSSAEEYLASGQLQIVEGSMPNDLPPITWGKTDAIVNCAASLQLFSNGNGDPFKTNVAGIKSLLDWADAHNIHRLHAVSTAYTCGWNSGTILERFHQPEPKFQTDYEKSKWMAEMLMAEWSQQAGRTLTVYRPSFLIGDSETGYTCQFAGFYQFARLVSMLKRQYDESKADGEKTYIPLRIPGRPEDRQNIVPVDFAAKIIAEIILQPGVPWAHLPPDQSRRSDQRYDEASLRGVLRSLRRVLRGPRRGHRQMLQGRIAVVGPVQPADPPRRAYAAVRHEPHRRGDPGGRNGFPQLTPERIYMLFDFAAARDWGRHANSKKQSSPSQ